MIVHMFLIKFFELVLASMCLGFHCGGYDLTDIPTFIICSGTYFGYVIILSGEIIGEFIFAPLDLIQDMFYGMVGLLLFAACGGLILIERSSPVPRTGDRTAALITGVASIVLTIILCIDLILTYFGSEQFQVEKST